MKYHLTPDIWLQEREDRTLVSNVRTGRRALLSSQELEQLEHFTGEPSLEESESFQFDPYDNLVNTGGEIFHNFMIL